MKWCGLGGMLLLACCTPKPQATLWLNMQGLGWQGDTLIRFQALALSAEGRILARGTELELRERYQADSVVDMQGRVVMPGLTDAHGHLLGLGEQLALLNLMGTPTRDSMMGSLRRYATQNPATDSLHSWLLGRGWNHELWPDRALPTATELESAAPGRPVWLARVDGHAGVASLTALQRAGITAATPDPPGGRIVKDAYGKPTGVLVDAAMSLIERVIPPATEAVQAERMAQACRLLLSLGVTSVHDAGITPAQYDQYRHWAEQRRPMPRVYAMISGTDSLFDEIHRRQQQPLASWADDRLAVRAVKLYADGALGSRGAALLAPYADDTSRGLLFETTQQLQRRIEKVSRLGYQVCIHAIGDRANRTVLQAFQQVDSALVQGRRHRIEHAQVMNPADIPLMRRLGLVASVQPTHATSDRLMAEARLGPGRLDGAYPYLAFLEAGIPLAAGSDFPVERPHPWEGVYAAATRQDTLGRPPGGWLPSQRLTRVQALHAFTLGAAYAAFQENTLGSLAPGQWADAIVLSHDPLAVPDSLLWRIEVKETYLAGKRVF